MPRSCCETLQGSIHAGSAGCMIEAVAIRCCRPRLPATHLHHHYHRSVKSEKWHRPSYLLSTPTTPSSCRAASRALAGICWLSGSAVRGSWRNRQCLGCSARSGPRCSRGSRRPKCRATALGCDRHTRWRVAICWSLSVIELVDLRTNLPNATKSDERRPRPGPSALLDDLVDGGPLVDGCPAVDEVLVATEGDDDRRTRRGFYPFFGRWSTC